MFVISILIFLTVIIAQSFSGAVVHAEASKTNSLPMNEGAGAVSHGYGTAPFDMNSEGWTSPTDQDLWQDDSKFGKVYKANRQHYNGASTFDLSAASGNASLALWIKVPTTQTDFNYLIKDYNGTDESQFNWNLYVHQDHNVYLEIKNNGGAWLELTNSPVNTGEWLHFAVVIDRTHQKVISYANGEMQKNLDLSIDGAYAKTQIDALGKFVGAIVGAKSNVGLISHIDYYNTAISQNAINMIMSEDNKHFVFNMDEGAGWLATESNYGATSFDSGSWTSPDLDPKQNWANDAKFGKTVTEKVGFANGSWSLPFDGAEGSFGVWIKMPTDPVGDQVVLADTGVGGTKFKIYSHSGDNHKLYLYMPDGNQQYFDLTTSGVNTGEWLHFAMTIDKVNKHVKTYVNGMLEKDGFGWDLSKLGTSEGTIIGADDNTILSHLNIYNYAIDDKEIDSISDKVSAQSSFGLNEGKGQFAYDKVGGAERLVNFNANDFWQKDSKMGNIFAAGKSLCNGAFTFDITAPKLTLGFWIKVPEVLDNPEIIFENTDFVAFGWKLYIHNITETLFIQIENGIVGNAADDIFYELSTQKLNNGEWTHVAIAVNNEIGKINTYVNGQLDQAMAAKLSFTAKSGIIVGGSLNKMVISHIEYYEAALDQWQVAKRIAQFDAYDTNLYQDDILFNYNLTENTGAVMYDASKHQNHIIMPFAEWQRNDGLGMTVGENTKFNVTAPIKFDNGLSITAKINLTQSDNLFRVLWSINMPTWGKLTLMVNSIGKLYLEGVTLDNSCPISVQAGSQGDPYTDIIDKGWLTVTVTVDALNNNINIFIGDRLMAVLNNAAIAQLNNAIGNSIWIGDDASGSHGLSGNIADVACYLRVLLIDDVSKIDKNIYHLTQKSFDYQSDMADVAPKAIAGYNADEGEGHVISDVWGTNHAKLGEVSVWDKNGLGGYNLASDKDSFAYLDKALDLSGDFTISFDMRNYGSTSNFTFIMSCGGTKTFDPNTGLESNSSRWDLHLTPNGYVCLQNQGAWGVDSIVFPYDTRGKGWFNFAVSCAYNADTSMYDFVMYYNGLPVVKQSRATALSAPQPDYTPKKDYLFTLMGSQDGLFTMDGQASNIRFYDSAITSAQVRKVADGDGKATPPPSYLPPDVPEEDGDIVYKPDEATRVEFAPLNKVVFEKAERWGDAYPKVTAWYTDGSTKTLSINEYTISGFDTSTVGEKVITVSYGKFSKQFTITVINFAVVNVEITFSDKVVFKVGEEWGDAYPKVTMELSDGSFVVLSKDQYTVSGFDTSTAGEKIITVSYDKFSKQVTITVTEKSGLTTGAIVGISLGSVGGVACIVVAVFFIFKKKKIV